jgi:hypothetical protein
MQQVNEMVENLQGEAMIKITQDLDKNKAAYGELIKQLLV